MGQKGAFCLERGQRLGDEMIFSYLQRTSCAVGTTINVLPEKAFNFFSQCHQSKILLHLPAEWASNMLLYSCNVYFHYRSTVLLQYYLMSEIHTFDSPPNGCHCGISLWFWATKAAICSVVNCSRKGGTF